MRDMLQQNFRVILLNAAKRAADGSNQTISQLDRFRGKASFYFSAQAHSANCVGE